MFLEWPFIKTAKMVLLSTEQNGLKIEKPLNDISS